MPARSGSRRVYYVSLLFCLLVIKLLIACELFELVTATALQDQLLTRVVPSTDTSRTRERARLRARRRARLKGLSAVPAVLAWTRPCALLRCSAYGTDDHGALSAHELDLHHPAFGDHGGAQHGPAVLWHHRQRHLSHRPGLHAWRRNQPSSPGKPLLTSFSLRSRALLLHAGRCACPCRRCCTQSSRWRLLSRCGDATSSSTVATFS